MPRERDLTGIPAGTSVCATCKTEKDNTEFHWYTLSNRGKSTGTKKRKRVNGSCRPCRTKLGTETNRLKKKIVPLVPKPDYGCPCEACGRPVYANQSDIPPGVDGTYAWMFDHRHGTDNFRGWICNPCNTGFGLLGDTAETVSLRLKYLENAEHNMNPSQMLLEERNTSQKLHE